MNVLSITTATPAARSAEPQSDRHTQQNQHRAYAAPDRDRARLSIREPEVVQQQGCDNHDNC